MELSVFNQSGAEVGSVQVSDLIFSRDYNGDLVHQLVVRHRAGMRSGTRAQKNRSAVSYSTRKPWKQKGTGRARAGMKSSPLWRGGGVVFPSSPEEVFSKKINKKMYRVGMSCIYSELIRSGRLRVLDEIDVSTPKTKEFVGILDNLGMNNVLFCVDEVSENLTLSSRNLLNVRVSLPRQTDPVALVKYHNVLITRKALLVIEEDLSC